MSKRLKRQAKRPLSYELFKIRNAIEDEIKSTCMNQHKNLNSSDLRKMFELYKTLESTYTRPRNSKRLSDVICSIISGATASQEKESAFIMKLLASLIKIRDHWYDMLCPNFEPSSALEFVFDHACKERARFHCYRLASLPLPKYLDDDHTPPIKFAVEQCCPELERILLRYGALYCQNNVAQNGHSSIHNESSQSFSEQNVRFCVDLISAIVDHLLFLILDPGESDRYDSDRDLLDCGNSLLKDMPLLEIKYLHLWMIPSANDAEKMSILRQFNTYFPGLPDFFCCPLSLKHSCKLTVRRALNSNWQLPHGIYQLPIPNSIKNYLDLKDDC